MKKSKVGLKAREILNNPDRSSEYPMAFKKLKKAALRKDDDANFLLGLYYWQGKGVQKDIEMSLKHFKKAARLGNGFAMYGLSIRYMSGNQVEKNQKLALSFSKAAAEKGIVNAQYNITASRKRPCLGEFKPLSYFFWAISVKLRGVFKRPEIIHISQNGIK